MGWYCHMFRVKEKPEGDHLSAEAMNYQMTDEVVFPTSAFLLIIEIIHCSLIVISCYMLHLKINHLLYPNSLNQALV